MIVIGTAGWSIPRVCAERFPIDGTHLQRYGQVLRGVEINSSFYRHHATETYARWAKQTPRAFRFAVKLPRLITHEQGLRAASQALQEFLGSVAGLGQRLGPLLVQLPPSLAFEGRVARGFFALLRQRHDGAVVCEPRHASWFGSTADRLADPLPHRARRRRSSGGARRGAARWMAGYRLLPPTRQSANVLVGVRDRACGALGASPTRAATRAAGLVCVRQYRRGRCSGERAADAGDAPK